MLGQSSNYLTPKRLAPKLFACLVAAALATTLLPLPAFAEPELETNDSANPENNPALSVQEITASEGFKLIGNSTCEWKTENGVLTIQPAGNGNYDGTIGVLPNELLWPWEGTMFSSVVIPKKIVAGKSLQNFFAKAPNLRSITGLENLDTSNVEDMSRMFFQCPKLTTLNLSKFDTKNVTTMQEMFYHCESLKNLDLSSFNTSKVESMTYAFWACYSLESLTLGSGFNTAKVKDMSCMFAYCRSLPTLDLKRFNTSNVTDMHDMFSGCSKITELDLSTFKTPNVTNMSKMFSGCTALLTLNLENFNTTKASDTATGLFAAVNSLTKVTVGTGFTAQKAFPNKAWYNEKGDYFKQDTIPLGVAATYTAAYPYIPGDSSGTGTPGSTTKTITMYRLYNPNSGEHLFTKDANEYSVLAGLGWKQEGEAWKAPETGNPVYRLYNPNSGDHHYTTDKNEYDSLGKIGWNQEGVAWYSGGTKPVYRVFNPNVKIGTHHYTTDQNEYTTLSGIGWKGEGIGWYGM